MQSFQQQLISKQDSPQFDFADCNHHSVSDFLNHCHLNQYLDNFLTEGFDSINSLLEITEDDMIFMGVKRGHRRLLQREIATVKGIPRDQPLVTNMMGTKYSFDVMSASTMNLDNYSSQLPAKATTTNNSNNVYTVSSNKLGGPMSAYDTGLNSPRSMNSGIDSSVASGSSGSGSSSGPNMTRFSRLRLPQQPPQSPRGGGGGDNTMGSSGSSSTTNNSGNSSSGNIGIFTNSRANMSDSRSSSISSNDDDDSIDINESSAPTIKRKYRRHAKPDHYAPTKPPSAYIMFSNNARSELKNQNLSFADLAKIVGDQWKNLSHIEKQSYERMAMRDKDEYLAALEQYRQTPQYNRYQEYLNDFKSKQDAANRLIGRVRKRAKQKSPGSGSIADSSSNGNGNENGSSGSGSTDTYGDKDSVINRRQRRPSGNKLLSSQPKQQTKAYRDYDVEDIETTKNPPPSEQHLHHGYHHLDKQQQKQHQQQQSSDSGYTSQYHYNALNNKRPISLNQPPHQWRARSHQIMKGMLQVDFVPTTPSALQQQNTQSRPTSPSVAATVRLHSKRSLDVDDEEYDGSKRRSPRFNKSKSSTVQTGWI